MKLTVSIRDLYRTKDDELNFDDPALRRELVFNEALFGCFAFVARNNSSGYGYNLDFVDFFVDVNVPDHREQLEEQALELIASDYDHMDLLGEFKECFAGEEDVLSNFISRLKHLAGQGLNSAAREVLEDADEFLQESL